MSYNVIIQDYNKHLGATVTEHRRLKEDLPTYIRNFLPNAVAETIEMYNLNGERHAHNGGTKDKRLVIFHYATAVQATDTLKLKVPEKINGIENDYTEFLAIRGSGLPIISENGIPLAEWFEDKYQLNIVFNLFNKRTPTSREIFAFIMSEFNRLVFIPRLMEKSWKYTNNKAKLAEDVIKQIKIKKEARLRDEMARVKTLETEINQIRRNLKVRYDGLIQKRLIVDTEISSVDGISKHLLGDLDLIVNHPKAEDVRIENGHFLIYTVPLYINASNKKRYYGGKYIIDINLENSDVRFTGDNRRRAYWGNDPHPHVGEGGGACFGTASDTIAELSAQSQLYALFTILIDFLESANMADSAGKYVVRWDEVDKDGKIIKKGEGQIPEDEGVECWECEELFHESEMHEAYSEMNEDGELIDGRFVCGECLSEHYHRPDGINDYIANY